MCDIGVNTCDGEGWGLCNFEHMYFKKPQIVPDIPVFRSYCNPNNSTLIKINHTYFIDSSRDFIGGMGNAISPSDVAMAMLTYINDIEIYNTHSNNSHLSVSTFDWDTASNKLSTYFT